MDMSRMGQGQMIAAGGGALLIIGVFLHWAGGESAWDGFSIVHILMLLVGIAAIGLAVLPATGAATTLPGGAPLVVAALGVAVFGWAIGFEFEIAGQIGVWLAIIGSLGIAFGGYEASRSPVAPMRTSTTGSPAPPGTPVA
jgi:hypothetical protein